MSNLFAIVKDLDGKIIAEVKAEDIFGFSSNPPGLKDIAKWVNQREDAVANFKRRPRAQFDFPDKLNEF